MSQSRRSRAHGNRHRAPDHQVFDGASRKGDLGGARDVGRVRGCDSRKGAFMECATKRKDKSKSLSAMRAVPRAKAGASSRGDHETFKVS